MKERFSIPLRAILIGLLASAVPAFFWAAMVTINMKRTPSVPWSVLIMAIVLWLYWRFARRQPAARAGALSADAWQLALIGGGTTVAILWMAFAVLRELLHIPQQTSPLPPIPIWTLLSAIVMGSLVAGVVEEVGFRGVMQGVLERAWGVVPAIVVTSILFTAAHLTHGAAILPMLPFYFAVAVTYSVMTRATGSIRPAILLHFVGDVMMFTLQFLAARGSAGGLS